MSNSTLPSQPSKIDPKTISDLLAVDDHAGDLLKQLVELFVTGGPTRVEAISAAMDAGDYKKMNFEAHSLKSSAANLGARNMAALCQRLESAKDAAAAQALRALPAELKTEYELACRELQALASSCGKTG